MDGSRAVKLFRNGRNQAVRIPREFELAGDEAVMRRVGDRLIIEPRRRSLEAVLADLAARPSVPADEQLQTFERPPPRPFDL